MGKIVSCKEGYRRWTYVENQSNNFIKNMYKLSTVLSHNPTRITVQGQFKAVFSVHEPLN
jgi:hypothetical protein